MYNIDNLKKMIEEKDFEAVTNAGVIGRFIALEDCFEEKTIEKFKNNIAADLVYEYKINLDTPYKTINYQDLPVKYKQELNDRLNEILEDNLPEDVFTKDEVLYRLENIEDYDIEDKLELINMLKFALENEKGD